MNWDDPPVETYDTARTHAALWLPAPGVVVTRADGVGDLGSISIYTRKMDELVATGRRYHVFHHWQGVTSFRPEAREHVRKWASTRLDRLNDARYLVGSKLVAMAISVASLALGRRLRVTTREAEFSRWLDEAIADARARVDA